MVNSRAIPELLDIPEVLAIANRLGKSPAQILLKWILKRGVAAIPKSTNENRLRQNLSLFDFDLTVDDMNVMKGLNKGIRICTFDFFQGYVLLRWVAIIWTFETTFESNLFVLVLELTNIQNSHGDMCAA